MGARAPRLLHIIFPVNRRAANPRCLSVRVGGGGVNFVDRSGGDRGWVTLLVRWDPPRRAGLQRPWPSLDTMAEVYLTLNTTPYPITPTSIAWEISQRISQNEAVMSYCGLSTMFLELGQVANITAVDLILYALLVGWVCWCARGPDNLLLVSAYHMRLTLIEQARRTIRK